MPDASSPNPRKKASQTPTPAIPSLGAQLKRARETAARSVKDCAQQISISAAQYEAYEDGSRQPGLPELEQLALFLQVPLAALLDGTEFSPLVPSATEVAEIIALRTRIIGARLRKARIDRGEDLPTAARAMGLRAMDLERIELANRALPLYRLDQLAAHLGLTRADFFESKPAPVNAVEEPAPAEPKSEHAQQFAAFMRLPADVRGALLDVEALEYVRAGLALRAFRPKDLRRAGRALTNLAGAVEAP